MNIKEKKVTVLGIGKSGAAAARLLRSKGAKIFLSEGGDSEAIRETSEHLQKEGFEVEIGRHSKAQIRKSAFVVVSPGIKPSSDVYRTVLSLKIPIYSEIEIASWFLESPFVVVSGTNGKTTVTTLITKILCESGRPAISCGNIGNPFSGEIDKINKEKLIPVVEVSSFQLMNTDKFKPHVGVLLNLEPDHLDWHSSLKEYFDSKFFMFRNQTRDDFAVVNSDDAQINKRLEKIPSQIKYFKGKTVGKINPNWAACIQVAQVFDLDMEKVILCLNSFPGIEHRLELVPSEDGRNYINDSKSTNISSLVWALNGFDDPVILILGGKNKGGNFKDISEVLAKKTKHIVLFGQASGEIHEALRETLALIMAGSLKETLLKARGKSDIGDTILFSPACASFDMFKNYEDRGRQFKDLVKEINKTCHKTASAY